MNFLKLIFCLFFITVGYLLSAQDDSKRILFVGNSYTYFWNLPHTVDLMAESQGIDLVTRQSTAGGANWGHHWKGERNLKSRAKIDDGDFDIIVLQNHSMSTIDRLDSLMHYGELLNEQIIRTGAQTYLYMT